MTTIKFSQLPDLPLGNIDAGTYAPVVDAFTNYTVTMGNMTAYVNQNSGNISVTGTVSATGNITGAYILGNGSQLTGLPATYGNANVAAFLAAFGSNTITTTGNVVVGNVSGGNGNIDGKFYNLQGLTGNSTAYIGRKTNTGQGNRAVFNFQNSTSNAFHSLQFQPNQVNLFADAYNSGTGLDTWAEVDMNVSNITSPYVSINLARSDTGAEIYWNYDITGNITLPGNASAINYANGTSILSGLAGTYGNANVATFMADFGSNSISTTGNVTSGNVNVGGVVSAAGNVRGLNINTTGLITATGNVTGNYFIGNGSQLTGIATSTYGNANVAANLAAFGSNPISTSGNVTAGYFIGDGSFLSGLGNGSVSNSAIQNGNSYVSIPGANGTITMSTVNSPNTAGITIAGNANVTIQSVNGYVNMSPGTVVITRMVVSDVTGSILQISSGGFSGNNFSSYGVISSSYGFVLPSYNASVLRAITSGSRPVSGGMAAVLDNQGKIAYWNTTANEWRYINGDTAV
jgi:hypothetical protein